MTDHMVRFTTNLTGVQTAAENDSAEALARSLLAEGKFDVGDAVAFWDMVQRHSTPKTRAFFHG